MKCSNCGAEIRVGSVYCEACGQPAQIVPDYNILEDDYLVSLLDEEKKKEKAKETSSDDSVSSKKTADSSSNKAKKKEKKWYQNKKILIPVIIIAALLVIAVAYYFIGYTSYAGYINRGLKKDTAEEYTEAIALYNKAIEKDDTRSNAYILAADDYVRIEDYESAISYYEKAISISPNSVSAYRGLINAYIQSSNYDALTLLEESTTNAKILALFDEAVIDGPIFSLSGGSYDDDVSLELSSDDGYEIYYTTDGSSPTGSGRILYEDAIAITEGSTTIKAACYNGSTFSQVVTNKYTITYGKPSVSSIDVSPSGGTFSTATQVSIEVPSGCTVYYTWDGSVPDESSAVYNEPIDIPEGNNILSVLLIDSHGNKSDVTQFNYRYIPN